MLLEPEDPALTRSDLYIIEKSSKCSFAAAQKLRPRTGDGVVLSNDISLVDIFAHVYAAKAGLLCGWLFAVIPKRL